MGFFFFRPCPCFLPWGLGTLGGLEEGVDDAEEGFVSRDGEDTLDEV